MENTNYFPFNLPWTIWQKQNMLSLLRWSLVDLQLLKLLTASLVLTSWSILLTAAKSSENIDLELKVHNSIQCKIVNKIFLILLYSEKRNWVAYPNRKNWNNHPNGLLGSYAHGLLWTKCWNPRKCQINYLALQKFNHWHQRICQKPQLASGNRWIQFDHQWDPFVDIL